jgi:hypothetical protein
LLEVVLAASPTLPPPAIGAIGRVELPEVMEPIAAATVIEVLAAAHTGGPTFGFGTAMTP